MPKLLRNTDQGSAIYYCPGCKQYHQINSTWTITGTDEEPTVNPSILVRGYLNEQIQNGVCHSFIRKGKIEFLSDCSHELKGQTVSMVEEE